MDRVAKSRLRELAAKNSTQIIYLAKARFETMKESQEEMLPARLFST